MKNVLDFVKRHLAWFLIGISALIFLGPGFAEMKTLLFIIAVECIAIALSGIAGYAYTNIDFTNENVNSNLGFIFLGVHVCIGLVVLGVYIAQFS